MVVSLTFKLNDKQLERAKEAIGHSNASFHDALGNFPIENVTLGNDNPIIRYYDDIHAKHYVWLGDVLGFFKVKDKDTIPNITAKLSLKRLIVTGDRDIITQQEIVERIAAILGKSWRVAEPEVTGDQPSVKLFWWESMEHYIKWRSDWDTYFEWLLPQIDVDKGFKKFNDRFYDENNCLSLLRSGKLAEARQKYPKIVDQILKVA